MASTFQKALRCLQIRMSSSVMLQSFQRIDGSIILCPLEFLPPTKKSLVKTELQTCLSNIMDIAREESKKKKKFFNWGKKTNQIDPTIQDQIDPYLSCFHDLFSMVSGLTCPNVDPNKNCPSKINFYIDTRYIAEGETDNVRVSYNSEL